MKYVSILMLMSVSAAMYLACAMNHFPKKTDAEMQEAHKVDEKSEAFKFIRTLPEFKDDLDMQAMWKNENASDKERAELADTKMKDVRFTSRLKAQLMLYLEGEGFWAGPGNNDHSNFWTGTHGQ